MNLKILFALLVYWGLWGLIFASGASVLFPAGASFEGVRVSYPQFNTSEICAANGHDWVSGCAGILDCPKIQTESVCYNAGCSWESICLSLNAEDVFGNQEGAGEAEIDKGGLFGTGLSFMRFISLTFLGIGLPASTPAWAMVMFGLFQSCITILGVGFFISSIWNG
jgi:hypothetical protein